MTLVGWLVALVAFLCCIALLGWVWLRRNSLGSLTDITTSSVAYDHDTYGHILTWDKHCFYIHGEPVMLLSGEFHYWRMPDRSRWESILKQYKNAGLNCIRIYFHWGEGVYLFDGNKDIDYLMSICEKLRIYVLAAPGPYICAETQGGGIPAWLISKRHVRIRHCVSSFLKMYDAEFSKYCAEWLNAILPILAKYQITSNEKGCLLALQLENENFELFKGIPMGLADDMRFLAKTARDAGFTVPFFTNDAWEEGSFVARDDKNQVLGKPTFGLDLYGFDKYVVFCPTSSPMATLVGTLGKSWKEWNPSDVKNNLDGMEKKVRGFGGGAASSPIFIPELQGGWFNHYTVHHTYDDVYDYYGENYTRLVLDTCVAQGVTALSYYIFYGGTNWGTLGDPDVYTSYDYSACIREFGHFSGRGRLLRLGMGFLRSFSQYLCRTDAVETSFRSTVRIESSLPDFICRRRRTVGKDHVDFVFFRNLNAQKHTASTISIVRPQREPLQLKCKLTYKTSFVGLGNYTTKNNLRLLLSTLPIHLRMHVDGHEVWIIQCDDVKNGQLAFQGDLDIKGTLTAQVRREDGVSILSFKESAGWASIAQKGSSDPLYLVALTGHDLYTLTPVFEESYFVKDKNEDGLPYAAFWGSYTVDFDPVTRHLNTEQQKWDEHLFALSSMGALTGFSIVSDTENHMGGMPLLQKRSLPATTAILDAFPSIDFKQVESRPVDLKHVEWKELVMTSKSVPAVDAIDFGYISGHVLYKIQFSLTALPASSITLDINFRHRAKIYLNGTPVGEAMNYSLQLFKAGSKNGPDIGSWDGWHKYQLQPKNLETGLNELVVVCESLGLNRQPFVFNDVRSPRGVLEARLRGGSKDVGDSMKWFIAGVDVRPVDDIFNMSGFPCEGSQKEWESTVEKQEATSQLQLAVPAHPTWFKSRFSLPESLLSKQVRAPLRLHIQGDCSAYLYINGTMILRYYGKGQSPQSDFYVPEGLLKPENEIKVVGYAFGDAVSTLSIKMDFWKMKQDGFVSSGNVDSKTGMSFMLSRSDLGRV